MVLDACRLWTTLPYHDGCEGKVILTMERCGVRLVLFTRTVRREPNAKVLTTKGSILLLKSPILCLRLRLPDVD